VRLVVREASTVRLKGLMQGSVRRDALGLHGCGWAEGKAMTGARRQCLPRSSQECPLVLLAGCCVRASATSLQMRRQPGLHTQCKIPNSERTSR